MLALRLQAARDVGAAAAWSVLHWSAEPCTGPTPSVPVWSGASGLPVGTANDTQPLGQDTELVREADKSLLPRTAQTCCRAVLEGATASPRVRSAGGGFAGSCARPRIPGLRPEAGIREEVVRGPPRSRCRSGPTDVACAAAGTETRFAELDGATRLVLVGAPAICTPDGASELLPRAASPGFADEHVSTRDGVASPLLLELLAARGWPDGLGRSRQWRSPVACVLVPVLSERGESPVLPMAATEREVLRMGPRRRRCCCVIFCNCMCLFSRVVAPPCSIAGPTEAARASTGDVSVAATSSAGAERVASDPKG